MNKLQEHIVVFEHETLRIDRGEKKLTKTQLEALQKFYGDNGVPYYSLIHHGVRFNEYVGVIQVGKTLIEVLPKADKSNIQTEEAKNNWRDILINMLHAVGIFDIHAPSSSDLCLKANSILDLYFELFVKELEFLIHRGLVKKYRKIEGNSNSLKGSLKFTQHLNKNLVHQERFYVRYTTYDNDHILHYILYKALKLLNSINSNSQLTSRLGSLILNFPEFDDIKISERLFERIKYDRKTEIYKNAIEIARLILLNYHPDIKNGQNNVLALMFDMNLLWEQFIFISLRKYKPQGTNIVAQSTKSFWKPYKGNRSKIKPDIAIYNKNKDCIIIDTKWKNLYGFNPSPDDLRQMFVYMKYYNATKVALVYPGAESKTRGGNYFNHSNNKTDMLSNEECSVISITVNKSIRDFQENINQTIFGWINQLSTSVL